MKVPSAQATTPQNTTVSTPVTTPGNNMEFITRLKSHRLQLSATRWERTATDRPCRVRLDLLYRLRWSIFGDPSEIEVEEGLDEDGKERRAPFLSHSIADELIAQPPLTTLRVSSSDVNEAIGFYIAPQNFKYNYLVIQNEDESPITLRTFVTLVHDHLNKHKDVIVANRKLSIFDPWNGPPHVTVAPVGGPESLALGPHPPFFFKYALGSTKGAQGMLNVQTFAVGEMGISEENFWGRQRRDASTLGRPRDSEGV